MVKTREQRSNALPPSPSSKRSPYNHPTSTVLLSPTVPADVAVSAPSWLPSRVRPGRWDSWCTALGPQPLGSPCLCHSACTQHWFSLLAEPDYTTPLETHRNQSVHCISLPVVESRRLGHKFSTHKLGPVAVSHTHKLYIVEYDVLLLVYHPDNSTLLARVKKKRIKNPSSQNLITTRILWLICT